MWNFINTYLLGILLYLFPIITFIVAIYLRQKIASRIIVLSIVLITYIIITFLIFNSSFLPWAFIYTIIGFFGILVGDFFKKRKRKNNKFKS